MIRMKRFSFLRSGDSLTMVFVAAITVVEALFASVIDRAGIYITANILFITAIYLSAQYSAATGGRGNALIIFFRDWYLYAGILYIYSQASAISYPIHGKDFDTALIALDRMIFGTDPTHWAGRFAHPVLTEILQISYSTYYLFFIAIFFELYRRNDRTEFHSNAMLVVYGFYLSYIGYLLVPAVGPRFTLHDFSMTNTELPGLFFTEYLRAFINSGGGIIESLPNPAQFANRDTFPSGHTQLTLTAMYIAFTCRTKIRWGLLVVGTLLIISTVYMRYHYAVDVLAGMLFFLFAVWSGKKIDRLWNKSVQ